MSPRVSVVIPVYNRADQIGETLDSVWNQTFADFEVIVVDDGSTDDLAGALDRHHRDGRLRVATQANAGPAAARNRGIDEAAGEFIAYLDSDDQWFPHHLHTTLSKLDQTGAPAIYSPMIVDRGVGRFAARPSRPMHPDESFGDYRFVAAELVLLSTVVFRRKEYEHIRWDERLFYGDVDQYLLDLVGVTGPLPMLERATAMYNDVTGPHKLSQASVFDRDDEKFTNFLTWLDEQDGLSPQAIAAQQARNLSGVCERRRDSFRLIGKAYRLGAMSGTGAVRECIRARMPRMYRYLIDTFVYLRGQPLEDLLDIDLIALEPADKCVECAMATTVIRP